MSTAHGAQGTGPGASDAWVPKVGDLVSVCAEGLPEGSAVVRAVDPPYVKVFFVLSQQQSITGWTLIANVAMRRYS